MLMATWEAHAFSVSQAPASVIMLVCQAVPGETCRQKARSRVVHSPRYLECCHLAKRGWENESD